MDNLFVDVADRSALIRSVGNNWEPVDLQNEPAFRRSFEPRDPQLEWVLRFVVYSSLGAALFALGIMWGSIISR